MPNIYLLHINSHKLMESSQGSRHIYVSLVVKELSPFYQALSILHSTENGVDLGTRLLLTCCCWCV